MVTWALLLEHWRFLPGFVFLSALVLQPHLASLPHVAILCALLAIVGMWRWRRRRGAFWPASGWVPVGRHVDRRVLWLSGGLGALLWLPSVAELFMFSPNNIVQGLRLVTSPRPSGVGFGFSVPMLLAMANPWPPTHARLATLLTVGPTAIPRPELAWGPTAYGGAVMILAMLGVVLLVRRRGQRVGRLGWGVAVALGSLAIQMGAVAVLPSIALATSWEYLQVWAMVHTCWAILAWSLWRGWRPSWVGSLTGRRQPHHRLIAVAVTAALAGAAATATVVVSPLHRDRPGAREVEALIPELAARIDAESEAVGAKGSVLLDGDTWGTAWGTAWGAGYGLMRRGYSVHVATFGSLQEDWTYRQARTAPKRRVFVAFLTTKPPEYLGLPAGLREGWTLTDQVDGRVRVFVHGQVVP